MLVVLGFVGWQTVSAVRSLIKASGAATTPAAKDAVQEAIMYSGITFGFLVVGSLGWILCICSSRVKITRWRHVFAGTMGMGLGIQLIMRQAKDTILNCGTSYQCFSNQFIAMYFYQSVLGSCYCA
ncbi:hypothetical protein EON62_02690 [archaeon]|nr:MAG: hypothetical protein EON62_02690 [archaeon]